MKLHDRHHLGPGRQRGPGWPNIIGTQEAIPEPDVCLDRASILPASPFVKVARIRLATSIFAHFLLDSHWRSIRDRPILVTLWEFSWPEHCLGLVRQYRPNEFH